MSRYLGLRLAAAIPILLMVPLLVFLLMDLAPGDAATSIAGDSASPELIAQIRTQLHLDDPVLVRYGDWLGHAVQGDLGTSLTTHESVTTKIGRALPVTLSLALGAIVMTVLLGLAGGLLAVRKPDGWIDRSITVVASAAIAMPSFWLGLMLVLIFSVTLRWLPGIGYVPFADSPIEWFRHLLLPWFALAALPAAELARQLRAAVLDELGRDYVLAARARGIGKTAVIFRHTLKNAAVPVVTVLGYRLTYIVGGSAVVETVFAIRGLGSMTVDAAVSRDIPTLVGVVMVFTITVVVINTVVDMSYGYFNPRVRAHR